MADYLDTLLGGSTSPPVNSLGTSAASGIPAQQAASPPPTPQPTAPVLTNPPAAQPTQTGPTVIPLDQAREIRAQNPELSHLSDSDFADQAEQQARQAGQPVDLSSLRNQNILSRGVSGLNELMGGLGAGTEKLITGQSPEQNPGGLSGVLGRTASDVVSAAPLLALGSLLHMTNMSSGVQAGAFGGALGLYSYQSALNEGAPEGQAIRSGLINASLPLAVETAGSWAGRVGQEPGESDALVPSSAARRAAALGASVAAATAVQGLDLVNRGQWSQMTDTDKTAFLLSNLAFAGWPLAKEVGNMKEQAKQQTIAQTPSVEPSTEPVANPSDYLKNQGFSAATLNLPKNVLQPYADQVQQGYWTSGLGNDLLTPQIELLSKITPATPEVTAQIAQLQAYRDARFAYLRDLVGTDPTPVTQNGNVLLKSSVGGDLYSAFDEARQMQQKLNLPGELWENFSTDNKGNMIVNNADASVHAQLLDNGFSWQKSPTAETPDVIRKYSFENQGEPEIPHEVQNYINPDGTLKEGAPDFAQEYYAKYGGKPPPEFPATYYTTMTGPKGESLDLYKLTKDVGGKPFDSTVSRQFLEQQGYKVPVRSYSLEARVGDSMFVNNLVDNFNQAAKPREGKPAILAPDKNGLFDGRQILAAITKGVPDDITEMYKQKGLEDFLKGKVSGEAVRDWVVRNTPEVEVRKAQPNMSRPEVLKLNQYKHQLESKGYRFQANDAFVNKGEEVYAVHKYLELPDELKEYARLHKEAELVRYKPDAAKGFTYQVEPIPVDQMDRPVEIRVSEPQRTLTPEEMKTKPHDVVELQNKGVAKEAIKFRGNHLKEDKNTITFLRGYFPDKDTFHVFELQSDWYAKYKSIRDKWPDAKTVAEIPEKWRPSSHNIVSLEEYRNERRINLGGETDSKSNPLLPHYIKVALRAAVDHALSEGATKISLSTADTNMLVEGHDLFPDLGHMEIARLHEEDAPPPLEEYKVTNKETGVSKKFYGETSYDEAHDYAKQFGKIKQEERARAIYDIESRNFLRQITGDSGNLKSFGKLDIPSRQEPPYNDYLKSQIYDQNIGRVYDLTSLKPGWNRLFSIYDLDKQAPFNQRIDELAKSVQQDYNKTGQPRTWEQLMATVKDSDIIPKQLAWLKNQFVQKMPTLLSTFQSELPVGGFFDPKTGEVAANWGRGAARDFASFAHEVTHSFVDSFASSNPVAYDRIVGQLGRQSDAFRQAFSQDIINYSEHPNMRASYIAGNEFDKNSPHFADMATREMLSGMMESVWYKEIQSPSNRPFEQIIRSLPLGVQNPLRYIVDKFSSLFGSQIPSARLMFAPEVRTRLANVLSSLEGTLVSSQMANKLAYDMLGNMRRVDPETYLHSLTYGPEQQAEYTDKDMKYLPSSLRAVAKDILYSSENPDLEELEKQGVKVRTSPGLTNLTKTWQSTLGGIVQQFPFVRDWFNNLGNYRTNVNKDITGFTAMLGQDPDGKMDAKSALREGQRLLSNLQGNSARLSKFGQVLDADQKLRYEGKPIQTDEQVASAGLSPDDVKLRQNFYRMNEAVAYRQLQKMQQAHGLDTAQLLMTSQKLSVDDARAFGLQFQKFGDMLAKGGDNPQLALGVEASLRQILGAKLPILEPLGQSPLMKTVLSNLVDGAKERSSYAATTGTYGYATKVRLDQWVVRATKEGMAPTVSDWKTQSDAARQAARHMSEGYQPAEVEIMDQNFLKDRNQFYSGSGGLSALREARANTLKMIDEYSKTVPDSPGKQQMLDTLDGLRKGIEGRLSQNVNDAISSLGDKYAERRFNVAGFDPVKFIPNMLEYMQTQSAKMNHRLTTSESALQYLRPEVQANPQLLAKMKQVEEYSLNTRTKEASGLRRFMFNMFLNGSVKYAFQRLAHQMNAIPRYTELTGSYLDGWSKMTKAVKQGILYAGRGTTGDLQIDSLLKTGSGDGTLVPHELEAYLRPQDFDSNISKAQSFLKGNVPLGGKIGAGVSEGGRMVQQFLSSIPSTAEIISRRVSYLMMANHQLETLGRQASSVELQQIHQLAKNFVGDVNPTGDKSNRIGFIQTSAANPLIHEGLLTATTLQSYVIHLLSQLGSYWQNGKMGSWDMYTNERNADGSKLFGGSSSTLLNPSAKALVASLGHVALLAGVFGLPFAKDADNLLNELFGVNVERAVKQGIIGGAHLFGLDDQSGGSIADLATEGLPYSIGADTSGSLGLGTILNYNVGEPQGLSSSFGAAGAMFDKINSSVGQLNPTLGNGWKDSNSWNNVARQLSPNFISYWLKMADAMYRGTYKTQSGLPASNQKLSNPSMLSMMTGFQPSQVTADQNEKMWNSRDTDIHTQQQNLIVDQMAKALNQYGQTQDPAALAKAQSDRQDWLTKNPADDPEALTSAIAERQLNLIQSAMSPNLSEEYRNQANIQALPSVAPNTVSRVALERQKLQTAQLLGDFQTLRSFMSNPDEMKNAVIFDSLVKQGMSPGEASIIVNKDMNNLLLLQRALAAKGALPQGNYPLRQ